MNLPKSVSFSAVITIMKNRNAGKEYTISANRISRPSVQPPWNPANRPIVVPTSSVIAIGMKPTISEVRVP